MASFSRDENDNTVEDPFIDGFAASTPKRPRFEKGTSVQNNKLVCPHCGKVYVAKFYYNKHVASHTAQETVPTTIDLDISVITPTDLNDISFGRLRTAADDVSFAVPAVPSKPAAKKKPVIKKKPHLICTYCLKGYVCSRSFKSHIRAHQIQSLASRYPDVAFIIDNSVNIANKAMTRVANCPSEGKNGQLFKEVVGHIAGVEPSKWEALSKTLCAELVEVLQNKKCLLPSALASSLIDQLENVLTNLDQRKELLKNVDLLDNCSDSASEQFYLEFCLKFVQEIIIFIRQHFQGQLACRPAKEIIIDMEDRQVIFYIAGSIMRGYLKIARNAKKSLVWKNIAAALQSNVLTEKPEGEILPDSEWTLDLDRGGLLYINLNTQLFFVNLTKVVFESEKKDGSIPFESVISKVSNSEICVQWDNIIMESLTESVSVGLMNDVVLYFCRTCCRGFARRRLNFLRKKPVVSMPTRHLVASRKNR